MTEDEAKKKWCPFARPDQTVAMDGLSFSRKGDCIASACMAWRWQTDQHGPDPEDPGGDLIRRPDLYGYCGLAGAPQ